jgi:hypothetical protein
MSNDQKEQKGDLLSGMKAICQYLNNVSEATVLKWHRECGLPIKKAAGIWVGSRRGLDRWLVEFIGT